MSESDLIQTLVLQFLQHDGYVDTAKAFAEEVNQGKQAMRQSLDPALEDMTTHDNEDAGNRQRRSTSNKARIHLTKHRDPEGHIGWRYCHSDQGHARCLSESAQN